MKYFCLLVFSVAILLHIRVIAQTLNWVPFHEFPFLHYLAFAGFLWMCIDVVKFHPLAHPSRLKLNIVIALSVYFLITLVIAFAVKEPGEPAILDGVPKLILNYGGRYVNITMAKYQEQKNLVLLVITSGLMGAVSIPFLRRL